MNVIIYDDGDWLEKGETADTVLENIHRYLWEMGYNFDVSGLVVSERLRVGSKIETDYGTLDIFTAATNTPSESDRSDI